MAERRARFVARFAQVEPMHSILFIGLSLNLCTLLYEKKLLCYIL